MYLSPRDYHRVHMPFAGTLTETLYVPGELFSVNQTTAENIPGLFARNERMVCLFDTELGRMAVVLVGAMIVAGIETVATGKVKPSGRIELNQHDLFLEKVLSWAVSTSVQPRLSCLKKTKCIGMRSLKPIQLY